MPLLGPSREERLQQVSLNVCTGQAILILFAEDDKLGKQLVSSEKDRAEHIMLVDLARNDVNRVCKPDTVKVDHLMAIQKFSHVIHLTSQVSGMLREGLTRYFTDDVFLCNCQQF